ncbi:D-tyrosyl-tRNA(Tyr) deacylase [Puttea exsequens]|nr:D-tyrosyl-tRNA(Tyr) deacylase [Puttea exsequens]
MASKVLKMKLWPDETGATKWKQSVQDIEGEVLCGSLSRHSITLSVLRLIVSQFTLLASTKKGNKPDFHGAAGGNHARELYDHFYAKVQELYDPAKVKNGVFQAMMEVNIQNSGPVSVDYSSRDEAVTIEIETNPAKTQQDAKKAETSAESEQGDKGRLAKKS